MSNESTENPLSLSPQREKKGIETFRKYDYQYHWAFCRLLDEHGKGGDYAIFIEQHEDVTIADSLDSSKAKFEFNQVKEVGAPLSIADLVRGGRVSSILGKMLSGATNKKFSPAISKINLVSTGGFSFDLHKKGYKFQVIEFGRLSEEETNLLTQSLAGEGGDGAVDLSKLAFLIPDLQPRDFENAVKGRISVLVERLAPGSKCHAGYIYDCIIRDLYRKGENEFDYSDWKSALERKAVTGKQVSDLLDIHVSRKPDERIMSDFNIILAKDFDCGTVRLRNISRGFQRYYSRRIFERTESLDEVAASIQEKVMDAELTCDSVKEICDRVFALLTREERAFFSNSEEEAIGAIIFEFLSK